MIEMQSIVLGATQVVVQDDQFINAYQEGYLRFKTQFAGQVLSDMGIYHFIAQNIYHIENHSVENARYITGWMAELFENSRIRAYALLFRELPLLWI